MNPPQFFNFQTYIFDVDSTISMIEGIDELARLKSKYDEVAKLTYKAMKGDISFEEVFEQRLSLIQPTSNDLNIIGQLYIKTLSPGLKDLISLLQEEDKDIYIVSGGYQQAIDPLAKFLKIQHTHVFANNLLFTDKGQYCGYDKTNLLSQDNGKQKLLELLRPVIKSPSLMIGDSKGDAETKGVATSFAYFGGAVQRTAIAAEADFVIKSFEHLLLEIETNQNFSFA